MGEGYRRPGGFMLATCNASTDWEGDGGRKASVFEEFQAILKTVKEKSKR